MPRARLRAEHAGRLEHESVCVEWNPRSSIKLCEHTLHARLAISKAVVSARLTRHTRDRRYHTLRRYSPNHRIRSIRHVDISRFIRYNIIREIKYWSSPIFLDTDERVKKRCKNGKYNKTETI